MPPKPYYDHGGITIYHGDCREILPQVNADVMITDPPYGIDYQSNWDGTLARSIVGDSDTTVRDWLVDFWGERPALIFGTWKVPRPANTRQILIWDTLGALGMGALDLPWKPSHQQIYVLGKGFSGYRGSDVLSFHPAQSTALRGRMHPHEKPVDLLSALIKKCPMAIVVDPCMGSGSTLLAAQRHGKSVIGIEVEEKYCETTAKRLAQEVLDFGATHAA